jgi:hypothetical protein
VRGASSSCASIMPPQFSPSSMASVVSQDKRRQFTADSEAKDMDGRTGGRIPSRSRNSPTAFSSSSGPACSPARPRCAFRWPSHDASSRVRLRCTVRDRMVPISGLARAKGCCVIMRNCGTRMRDTEKRAVPRDGRRGVRPTSGPTVGRLHGWDSLRLAYRKPSAALHSATKRRTPPSATRSLGGWPGPLF